MDLKNRFLQFLKTVDLSQKELGEKTGYSQQSLSKFFTGGTKSLKSDLFIALAGHFPTLNLNWLLLGEGEMFLVSPQDQLQRSKQEKVIKENQDLAEQNAKLQQEINDLRQLIETKDTLIRTKAELISLLKKNQDT